MGVDGSPLFVCVIDTFINACSNVYKSQERGKYDKKRRI